MRAEYQFDSVEQRGLADVGHCLAPVFRGFFLDLRFELPADASLPDTTTGSATFWANAVPGAWALLGARGLESLIVFLTFHAAAQGRTRGSIKCRCTGWFQLNRWIRSRLTSARGPSARRDASSRMNQFGQLVLDGAYGRSWAVFSWLRRGHLLPGGSWIDLSRIQVGCLALRFRLIGRRAVTVLGGIRSAAPSAACFHPRHPATSR